MRANSSILGIDIGSVSIAVAEIDPAKEVIKTSYEFHHGNITENLKKVLHVFDLSRICAIGATSSTPSVLKVNGQYDNRVSVMVAARHFHKKVGAILVVGGERFGLIGFDEDGNYRSFKTNTSCAAGTGSFLDQQARRLNLSGAGEIGELALQNRGAVPKIASRCAVFAKTDLVHAQQEGYSIEQICDGLCYGVANNIVDTLLMDKGLNSPIIFTGGVSKNRAVVHHIMSITGMDLIVDDTGIYGAIGAAFLGLNESLQTRNHLHIKTLKDVLIQKVPEKEYFHVPLGLELSHYPEFVGVETYEHAGDGSHSFYPVEVDIYETLEPLLTYETYLGVDIGSTSTKAVLLNKDAEILAGLYTRTAGRPVAAIQRIFSSIENIADRKKIDLRIMGAATTGSGRKFAGKILGADVIIDEITAHATAACKINPEVDTIIEIGGQDSKFTTLKDGMVTFSVMNNVCAAGTGSFIEEQAQKLGCPLRDYSSRAENKISPIASDRCTVFMEKDINHYLNEGYAVDEVLASVLHSIRENYLTKVAIESTIGETIFFQGATAKNRALVAAFEQRLGKPIYVSKFCHLTGAIGSALTLIDQGVRKTRFRGIGLYKKKINVKSEVCELCTNHCKITVADVQGEKVAYGFLCGREYDIKKYVNNNLSGFDLLKERKKAFSIDTPKEYVKEITVGIPAALHIFEDLPLWKRFFAELRIKTVTSEGFTEAIKNGKHIAGAEFCAPMAALHGHVEYLLNKSDYIFLPVYLERKADKKMVRRQYCYYTQFSSSLASTVGDVEERIKFLRPLVAYQYSSLHTKLELYRMLRSITGSQLGLLDVFKAYDKAREFKRSSLLKLKEKYTTESRKSDDIHVVFLGRPYTILSRVMNKGIPEIFASLGIMVFFQDMVTYLKEDLKPIQKLLDEIHWYYASEILKVAQVVAKTRGAYPVLITSFKCSPDSFVIEYFKKIMESHGKPYLILQLDEHDSSIGYETRIEAAVRSFKNHYSTRPIDNNARYSKSLVPSREKKIWDKTLIIPNWDNITLKLVASNLKREGIDARVMEESETNIRKSLRHNTGQCIPINIIAQEFVDYVEKHDLDPSNTLLWQPLSKLGCNIGLYPHHIKTIIHSFGNGMEKADVYVGAISFIDISLRLPVNAYFAYKFGGLIRKMGCKIRPYEKEKGATDRAIEKSIKIFTDAFLGLRSKEDTVAEVVSYFEAIEVSHEQRPKVAIFGDLYVRDNEVMNQDLIHFIEENNGEVIVTPYTDYVRMIARTYLRKWLFEGNYFEALYSKALLAAVTRLEKTYDKYFGRILDNLGTEYNESPERILSQYNIKIENTGESMDNILKVFYLTRRYPDLSLFVQTSPAFCCPSLVTEAMAKEIERNTGIPVVSITYDGTAGNKNDAIIPYLRYPRETRCENSVNDTVMSRQA